MKLEEIAFENLKEKMAVTGIFFHNFFCPVTDSLSNISYVVCDVW